MEVVLVKSKTNNYLFIFFISIVFDELSLEEILKDSGIFLPYFIGHY